MTVDPGTTGVIPGADLIPRYWTRSSEQDFNCKCPHRGIVYTYWYYGSRYLKGCLASLIISGVNS